MQTGVVVGARGSRFKDKHRVPGTRTGESAQGSKVKHKVRYRVELTTQQPDVYDRTWPV